MNEVRAIPPQEQSRVPMWRAIIIVVVAVSLTAGGVWVFFNQRRLEEQDLNFLATALSERLVTAQVAVKEKAVVNGQVRTQVLWNVLDRGMPIGIEHPFWIEGETLRIETASVRINHPALADNGFEVQYFRSIGGMTEERQAIQEAGEVPQTHKIRGDIRGHVKRTESKLWRAILGGEAAPRFEITAVGGERIETDLAAGDRIEVRIDERGSVELVPIYREVQRLERFKPDRTFYPSKSLAARVVAQEQVLEWAGEIRPDLEVRVVHIEVRNLGDSDTEIDLSTFALRDSQERVFPCRSDRVLHIPADGTLFGKLRFYVPHDAQSLQLIQPDQQDKEHLFQVHLNPPESGLGDPVFAGDFGFVAKDWRRSVEGDHFEAVVDLIVLNLSDEPRTIEPNQISIERAGETAFLAKSISVETLPPYLPTAVTISIPLGSSLEREDLRLHIIDAKKRVSQEHARLTLAPAPGGSERVVFGSRYLDQVAAVAHYQMWLKLRSGRVFRDLFGGKKERQEQAAHHLKEAKRLFPDSETIAGAR